jgi:O-antigen/teichoic acid export membrane protein
VISTIIILYVYYQKEDLTYLFIAIIASISLVLLSFEVLEYFYIAQVKAKYIFLSKFIGKIFSSLLKIIFILLNAGVVYFAIANSSLFFITFFLLYFYFLKEKLSLSFNFFIFKRGINYLKESWPLIFSGIFAVIYLNIDKIMIEEMLNSTELGIYSVAVKLSTIWYFFPNLIRQGFLPAFVNSKIKNEEIYKKRLYLFFSITVTIAYLIIIPVSLLSDGIINLLFGIEYLGAGRILAVHIFASLFVFIGIGRGIWMINESQFKFVMVANIIAGAINILLNYLWLPKFGIMGAAYATLISYSFTYFLSNIFYKPAHEVFVMQLKSLFLLGIFQNLKEKII